MIEDKPSNKYTFTNFSVNIIQLHLDNPERISSR